MADPENIALFDMDGTLCDYNEGLYSELEKIRSPTWEPIYRSFHGGEDIPQYMLTRKDLITSHETWWANLPRFQLGWDVLDIAKELGYRPMILTQAPKNNPSALAGKLRWLRSNLEDIDFTMTLDKGLVYGRVLVDDYPEYIKRWLTWRKNGLVIMPANDRNLSFSHNQVVRYDGSNLEEVRDRMAIAKH